MNWKLREINQTIEIFIKKKTMNHIDKLIKVAMKESLEEKTEELSNKIDAAGWTGPQAATSEDWNPQGPVTISGTDISEEDESEMDGGETDITDKSTGDNDENWDCSDETQFNTGVIKHTKQMNDGTYYSSDISYSY